MDNTLDRFIKAQEKNYSIALSEIRKGKKQSHWMWYIFPQIAGLGFSETSKYYAIKDIVEAQRYLDHPVLGQNLIEISTELLNLEINDPVEIMGHPDHLKLKSSMTLFAQCPKTSEVFQLVLNKFWRGEQDKRTRDTVLHQKSGAPLFNTASYPAGGLKQQQKAKPEKPDE
jgi:uncharacterized protein (DUF1810 family)